MPTTRLGGENTRSTASADRPDSPMPSTSHSANPSCRSGSAAATTISRGARVTRARVANPMARCSSSRSLARRYSSPSHDRSRGSPDGSMLDGSFCPLLPVVTPVSSPGRTDGNHDVRSTAPLTHASGPPDVGPAARARPGGRGSGVHRGRHLLRVRQRGHRQGARHTQRRADPGGRGGRPQRARSAARARRENQMILPPPAVAQQPQPSLSAAICARQPLGA